MLRSIFSPLNYRILIAEGSSYGLSSTWSTEDITSLTIELDMNVIIVIDQE